MGIEDELALSFYVIKNRRFCFADNDHSLLFERVEPTHKDVRLHAALELTSRQRGVIDLGIYVRTARGGYVDWQLVQEIEDGGNVMWGEAPEDILLCAKLAPVET